MCSSGRGASEASELIVLYNAWVPPIKAFLLWSLITFKSVTDVQFSEYSWLSLFTVVLTIHLQQWISEYWIHASWANTELGSYKLIFVNKLDSCIFLVKDAIFIHLLDPLTMNSRPEKGCLTHFLTKAHLVFVLGHARRCLCCTLRGLFWTMKSPTKSSLMEKTWHQLTIKNTTMVRTIK